MKSLVSMLVLVAAFAIVACDKEKNKDPQGGGNGNGPSAGAEAPVVIDADGNPVIPAPTGPAAPAAGLEYLGSVISNLPDGTQGCTEIRAAGNAQFITLLKTGLSMVPADQGTYSATEKCSLDGVVGICQSTKTADGNTQNTKAFVKGDAAAWKAKCEEGMGTWSTP